MNLETAASTGAQGDSPADAIDCPLCGYDLRGQIEPRCPECGYSFEWEALRDPARRLHRYFFEHHPERNSWSFMKTLVGGLRPRKFWGSLNPAGPARPARLVLYWLIMIAPVVPIYAVAYVSSAITLDRTNRMVQRDFRQNYGIRENGGALTRFERESQMTLPEYLDRFAPVAPSMRFFSEAAWRFPASVIGLSVLMWMIWPWATALLLRAVLRTTLKRARIRPIHLARCGVYCADGFMWAWLVATLIAAGLSWDAISGNGGLFNSHGRFRPGGIDPAVLTLVTTFVIASGLAALLALYRLISAYRHYLRLPHAAAVVLMTQFIVLLVVLIVLVNGLGTLTVM